MAVKWSEAVGGALCLRNAARKRGVYPVAKIKLRGSGSNKFGLAVLVQRAQASADHLPLEVERVTS
ncbi:hypothetical protein [Petrachloros mirabilis]